MRFSAGELYDDLVSGLSGLAAAGNPFSGHALAIEQAGRDKIDAVAPARLAQITAQENGARDQQKTTTDAAADQQKSRATTQQKTEVQHLDDQITALKKQHDAELSTVAAKAQEKNNLPEEIEQASDTPTGFTEKETNHLRNSLNVKPNPQSAPSAAAPVQHLAQLAVREKVNLAPPADWMKEFAKILAAEDRLKEEALLSEKLRSNDPFAAIREIENRRRPLEIRSPLCRGDKWQSCILHHGNPYVRPPLPGPWYPAGSVVGIADYLIRTESAKIQDPAIRLESIAAAKRVEEILQNARRAINKTGGTSRWEGYGNICTDCVEKVTDRNRLSFEERDFFEIQGVSKLALVDTKIWAGHSWIEIYSVRSKSVVATVDFWVSPGEMGRAWRKGPDGFGWIPNAPPDRLGKREHIPIPTGGDNFNPAKYGP